ncbi:MULTISPECIES: hypothetical protein [unclassified Variovorax]|jgi:PPE-repeat protein|uniref:hypothetical protein n=1 Tax=unclassified Variovorax TaxID=663243 RepID=UPI000F7F9070|nr:MULTISPECIES: hypothetical protein [unclassified Variovorax]RSZ35113.1 hypothetical protein EJO70_24900 [Variovorax sp. 553]RSZ35869.1 hypothetical protein EJO71_25590 [Variovorax sp. 679]
MRAPTNRQLAAGQIRSLRALRKKLLSMAAQWDGLDQFNLSALEELADRCETVATEMLDDSPSGDS